ncbi:MAG: hypothetical protein H6936_13135 [Burkholderiales bacterium]|nr:hypothetical protein [Burkholderiales bacterium]
MLNQDVNVSIMPYRNHDERRETSIVQLSSPNDLVEEDISLALSGNDYHRHNLEEAVSDFIRECASTIMHEGQAIYEIVHYTDEDTPEASFSKLEHVPNRNIMFLLGQPFQILPKLEDFEDKEPRFKKITKDKLVIFRMPKPYRSHYRALQIQIDMVGKDCVQNLHIAAMEEANKKKKNVLSHKINVMDGYKFSDLAVLSATNSIGWNARDVPSKYLQEYFTLVRFLRFERFKTELRNSILNTINDNLNRLIINSTYTGILHFHGLPTSEDIEKSEKDLREGSKPFKEIILGYVIIDCW